MIRFKGDRLDWHLDHTTMPSVGEYDLYTVAKHEMLHILGIGQSGVWDSLRSGLNFTGSKSIEVFNRTDADTANPLNLVPLDDVDHWDNSLQSIVASDGITLQDTLMGPQLREGQRLEITELDLAGLNDIGWEITAVPEPATTALTLGLISLLVILKRRKSPPGNA